MKKNVHSRIAPPRIGVNSNVGRMPQQPVIMTRIASRAAINALAVNESVAPVCPITREEVPPGQPGIKVPFVPRATDLESAIKAVNIIADIIATESTSTIRWLEKERGTAIVRIFNPQDDSQWVDVERITYLLMEDQYTGDLWYWELGESGMPAPSVEQATATPAAEKLPYNTLTVQRPPGY